MRTAPQSRRAAQQDELVEAIAALARSPHAHRYLAAPAIAARMKLRERLTPDTINRLVTERLQAVDA